MALIDTSGIVPSQWDGSANNNNLNTDELKANIQAIKDALDAIPTEVGNLTETEVQQLQNIDTESITNAQWAYLGAADQGVATTDAVTFATIDTGQGAKEIGGTASGSVPDNSDLPSTTFLYADDYTALRGISIGGLTAGETRYARGRSSVGDGGEGVFRWSDSDHSSGTGDSAVPNDEVTTNQGDGGIYVAPASDKTGASGAWVRLWTGALFPEWWGAKADGATSDHVAIKAAASAANRQISQTIYNSSRPSESRPAVGFQGGKEYFLSQEVSLSSGEARAINWMGVGGVATIKGDGTKTYKAFDADVIHLSYISDLNFIGFSTVWEWDTNNQGMSKVTYERCTFIENSLGVDTRSYATSRSCELSFIDCWTDQTDKFFEAYCDKINVIGGFYRNNDGTGYFALADANLTVTGGIFVPIIVGSAARWFDLYSSESGARGASFYNCRFGAENGGIPIVKNFIEGNNFASDRQVEHICFFGGQYASTSSSVSVEACVVLADDGAGNSYMPNMIVARGMLWNATDGIVATESGNDPINDPRKTVIDVDKASQVITGPNAGNVFVEDRLRKYVPLDSYLYPGEQNGGGAQWVSGTGNITIDPLKGGFIVASSSGTLTIDDIDPGYIGERMTIICTSGNVTLTDASGGSILQLNTGPSNLTMTPNDVVELVFNRSGGDAWLQVAPSATN